MGLLLILLILLAQAIVYGFGAAIQNLGGKFGEEENKKEAELKKISSEPGRFINTLHLLDGTAVFVIGILYVLVLRDPFRNVVQTILGNGTSGQEILLIAADVVLFIVLLMILQVFGIIIPKRLGIHKPEKWANNCLFFVKLIMTVFAPFYYAISGIAKGILFLCGHRGVTDETDVTEEEILSMVNEGHEQGVLLESEAEMISNIIEYGDKEAKDIMTNRNNIFAFDSTMTLGEAIDCILEEHYSRFPVYDETLDQVIGILYLKDAMRIQTNEKMRNLPIGSIRKLLKKPVFIPETKSIDSILRQMQSTKTQMVIVIDEYGQTSGLLTLEDILEEIVGNIEDEYDEDDSFVLSLKKEKEYDEYVIDGSAPLEELEEYLHISFENEPYETLNGFMIHHMEHIPEQDESYSLDYQGTTFSIASLRGKMIDTVKVVKKKVVSEVEQVSL